ncbi:hypothetical protein [Paenibacillus sp. FSL L8-0708]|uniref:hypothetical protein n=1 Tax=Paenibacillus sp. FSL L8-0708 TaxID=2975311 RepID=UPI0030F4F234
MKKKIIIITSAALMLGGSIGFAAASSPLIGAKVQGLFTVQKGDGTKIGDAVIINGSAYAPVRAISEATGTELNVEGKKIIMGDKADASNVISTNNNTITDAESREKIVAAIKQKEFNITDLEKTIGIYESMAKEMENNGDLGKRAAESAEEYKKLVEQRKDELADLQKQLAEIDAQIAELQK